MLYSYVMSGNHTTEALLCLIPFVLCMLTALILIIFSSGRSTLLLAASFLALGFFFGVVFLNYSHLMIYTPHLYRTGNLCWLLYIPLPFLYLRSIDKQAFLAWPDLLHLLPALLFIVDYFPFYISSAEVKLQIIRADQQQISNLISFREGWLMPPHFYVPARTFLMAFYWVLEIGLLAKLLNSQPAPGKVWKRWLLLYTTLQLPLFAPALMTIIAQKSYLWSTAIPPAAGAVLSCITLLMCPQILYSRTRRREEEQQILDIQKPVLDDRFSEQFTHGLEKLMLEKKPFLNGNYTLKEMAADLHMPLHQLSAYINRVTGMNFNDLLNKHRIDYCLNLIKNSDMTNLNLHGLALTCGFNNRNTFSTAFKKFTGKTPSDYLRNRQSDAAV